MDCSMSGFPVHHQLPELVKLMSIELEMPSILLNLCCPFLLLPSIFSTIKVFSNESALYIWWPKYWSFSFSISPSSEYSRLISFRIDWFDLLHSPRDSQESSLISYFISRWFFLNNFTVTFMWTFIFSKNIELNDFSCLFLFRDFICNPINWASEQAIQNVPEEILRCF